MATRQEWTSERRDPFSDYEARTRHDGDTGERSVGTLIGELAGETSALVRAEIALARKEMQGNLSSAQHGATAIGVGAGVLLVAVFALVAAAILALARVMPAWQAAAIVGVVIAIAGAIMVAVGKRKVSAEGIKPGRTLGSLNDMKVMAQHEHERAMRKWR